MSDWRPIKTVPKDGTPVDLWFSGMGGKRIPNCLWDEERECWEWLESSDGFSTILPDKIIPAITHWMPLPSPPTQEPTP